MSSKKYLKILCCDHFLKNLYKSSPDCDMEVNDKFYECSHPVEEHEVVALKCKLCRFNFSHGFERNYYTSTTCCCKSKPRTDACVFCKRLKRGLNLKILKICMEKKNFSFCGRVYIKINKYLED